MKTERGGGGWLVGWLAGWLVGVMAGDIIFYIFCTEYVQATHAPFFLLYIVFIIILFIIRNFLYIVWNIIKNRKI